MGDADLADARGGCPRRAILSGSALAALGFPGDQAAGAQPGQDAVRPRLGQLTIAIVSQTFFYVPLWAGIRNGAFKQAGIDIEIVQLGNASQVEPLTSGAVHVAIATPESVLQNVAAGGPLRIVAGNTGKLAHSLIARPPFCDIASLRGGRIGILNRVEGTFFQAVTMLQRHGLAFPDDFEVVETGGVPARHRALLSGTIDAGLQSAPWSYLEEDGGLVNLGNIIDYVPDWQFVSVNVHLSWATQNRDLLVRFLSVLLACTEWVYANREEAAKVAAAELPTEMNYALRAWDYYTTTNALTRDMSVSEPGLRTILEIQRREGLLDGNAPSSTQAYAELSFLDAARTL